MSPLRRNAPTLLAIAIVAIALMVVLVVALVGSFGHVDGPRDLRAPRDERSTTRNPAGTARDLGADERRGGHTLSRHVGLDAGELRLRLDHERNLTVASSFFDRATAERAVGELLERERTEIERWFAGRRDRLALHGRARGEPIGLSLRRGARQPERVHGLRAVLVRGGGDWFVLTAYPSPER